MTNQPSLFDVPTGIEARDKAINAAERGAPITWVTPAEIAIAYLAKTREHFTTDDVWEHLHQRGHEFPHEPRAMGALMRNAARAGLITATDRVTPSQRPECHRRPIRIWRSL
jgi:hypothetical protein